MKNLKFLAPVAGVLMLVSCKKSDNETLSFNTTTVESATQNKPALSAWKTVTNWTSEKNEGNDQSSGIISDDLITPGIVEKGMVLVFRKSNAPGAESLPFTDKNSGFFWYYQVNEGSLIISASSTKPGTLIDTNQEFRYIVLNEETINKLAAGQSKSELLNLSYDKAAFLFGMQ